MGIRTPSTNTFSADSSTEPLSVTPNVIEANFSYVHPDTPDHGLVFTRDNGSQSRANFEYKLYPVKIADVRGQEERFDLNTHGFQFTKKSISDRMVTALKELDHDTIKKEYYPEMAELVKKITGAYRVVIGYHVVREQQRDNPEKRRPADVVHNDNSPNVPPPRIIPELAAQVSAAEVDHLLKCRYKIINVWRPLTEPVEDCPLAFADAQTVKNHEVLDASLHVMFNDVEYDSPLNVFRHSDAHEWFYWSNQMKEEVTLMNMYDSVRRDNPTVVPHTAFKNPAARPNAIPRESVEVRAYVFDAPDA